MELTKKKSKYYREENAFNGWQRIFKYKSILFAEMLAILWLLMLLFSNAKRAWILSKIVK